ncbi:hypothetical protein M8C21_003368 [Ambrosia artemisiifolia]|uniref:Uncharacterized protein n=1 Tax=Ambrosia artemisiifolia TaxID=4212 RepID=A0AAD5GJX8_AMBAR|nr:hypothetical protein M8C21_003368 [Ambrosia artemisiifolia]
MNGIWGEVLLDYHVEGCWLKAVGGEGVEQAKAGGGVGRQELMTAKRCSLQHMMELFRTDQISWHRLPQNSLESMQMKELTDPLNSVILTDGSDKWKWEGDKDGEFSVADCKKQTLKGLYLRYRIPITIDDKTDFLDATVFDKAGIQLLEIPCKEMFAKPDPRTLIREKITAKPIQFTIRAVKDDQTALTTYSVNNVVRLQPNKNTDTSSSSSVQISATPAPLTPAPANPSINEKKGCYCKAQTV